DAAAPRGAAEPGSGLRLAHDPVRHRRAPGSHHGAGRPGRPVPEGHEEARRSAVAAGAQARFPDAQGRGDHVIEVENLTVRYGGVTSLDGMDLVFEKGTCGLIGPNGAGKTTFFNVLSG